jgi:mercuric ion transport protein
MKEVAMDAKATCNCSGNKVAGWAATGGILASLGICSACCLLPVILIALGVGGAWATRLEALAPYKWIFVGVTVALVAFGTYLAYFRPKRCAAGSQCQSSKPSVSIRAMLWVATILAVGGLIFDRIEPLLGG